MCFLLTEHAGTVYMCTFRWCFKWLSFCSEAKTLMCSLKPTFLRPYWDLCVGKNTHPGKKKFTPTSQHRAAVYPMNENLYMLRRLSLFVCLQYKQRFSLLWWRQSSYLESVNWRTRAKTWNIRHFQMLGVYKYDLVPNLVSKAGELKSPYGIFRPY